MAAVLIWQQLITQNGTQRCQRTFFKWTPRFHWTPPQERDASHTLLLLMECVAPPHPKMWCFIDHWSKIWKSKIIEISSFVDRILTKVVAATTEKTIQMKRKVDPLIHFDEISLLPPGIWILNIVFEVKNWQTWVNRPFDGDPTKITRRAAVVWSQRRVLRTMMCYWSVIKNMKVKNHRKFVIFRPIFDKFSRSGARKMFDLVNTNVRHLAIGAP